MVILLTLIIRFYFLTWSPNPAAPLERHNGASPPGSTTKSFGWFGHACRAAQQELLLV
jgi:hypothetical protein